MLAFAWVGLWPLGCAIGPGQGTQYVFFPPLPGQPRVQYLTSFSSGMDPDSVASKFEQFVTGGGISIQPIIKPYGVLMTSNLLLVCDTGTRAVDVLDLGQQTMQHFSSAGLGRLGVPINVAQDADGSRYVTDTARDQVLCFGPAGEFEGMLDDTNPMHPTGVALTPERIYVTDLNSHCVRVYAKSTRQLLFTIPKNPKAGEDIEPGKLYMPVNLAVDAHGRVYVSDLGICQVKIFDADGKFRLAFGSRGDLPGQFARPKGIAVDQAGRIFVVDAASQTCQIFDADGKLLLPFGGPEEGPAGGAGTLNLPAAVCVTRENVAAFKRYAAPGFVLEELIIISNQLGADKVSVFGLGHQEKP